MLAFKYLRSLRSIFKDKRVSLFKLKLFSFQPINTVFCPPSILTKNHYYILRWKKSFNTFPKNYTWRPCELC